MAHLSHLFIFLLVANLSILLSSNSIAILAAESVNESEIDLRALLSFKQAINNDPLGVLNAWNVSLDFCSWRGVTCGKSLPNRVVSLELNSLQLSGQLSLSLVNLTSLARLDLGNNHFSGPIPEGLGTLQQLESPMLATNKLAGNMSGSTGSLTYVNLGYNILSGGIPNSLASSSSLSVLNLTSNSLSGELPANLFNSSSQLTIVDLQSNLFVGPIPDFHKMVTLQILNLAGNNLSGSIPPSLGNVSSLTEIRLDTNNLVGSIPNTLTNIRNLAVLTLGYNNLRGYFPHKFFNISSLRILDLSYTSLVRQIPSDIGNSLPNLEDLIMPGNSLKGFIPASLSNASKLEIIDLSNNLLDGVVPSLGSLPGLNVLNLGNNFLKSDNWEFITSLTNCSTLMTLSIHGNNLDGTIPMSVVNLSITLHRLDLGNNQIVGTIPKDIGNKLQYLQLLALDQNSVSGEIPSSIGNLSTLVILSLSQNDLSGNITPAVGHLVQLSQLSLDDNHLTGNIPSLGRCKKLSMLNLSVNSLDGYIPDQLLTITTLVSLDLSNNYLTGSIPQIGALINLLVLNISYNHLSGQIPSSLGQCLTLSSFHMDNNLIDGMIPESFSNLKALQQIDLSQNNLTGPIPDFFNSFRTLERLDLSYNNFMGPVPNSGYFFNSTIVSLGGNTNLCSSVSMLALPVCPVTSKAKSNYSFIMLIVIPTITVALFLFFIITFTKKRAHTTPCYKETMKKVSYGDILKATNWFSPINKISSSHTGSIYIGRFEFDTDIVAIKVFHLNEHGSLNSFLVECEVLRNTRHRNLMKAVTVCSAVDLENNEFKAIVFDFMANGSVDMWVHPKSSQQETPKRGLSLRQRIRIAKDVASALDYMHNQLAPPLIHCDLKPANVLLDYDMTARVGDFGSAKFLTSSLATTEGFAGIGGTIGYIAPEYGMGHKISTRCDVYSFGILLLEMLTGKRPTDAMFTEGMSLHKLVSSAYPNELCEVLDPYMSLEAHHACATLVMQSYLVPIVEVALLCSMESPKDRPEMEDVCARIFAVNEAFLESW